MEDRQSSYFSTGPTPRKEPVSSRHPSAVDTTSRLGQTSVLGNKSRAGSTTERHDKSRAEHSENKSRVESSNKSRTIPSARLRQASATKTSVEPSIKENDKNYRNQEKTIPEKSTPAKNKTTKNNDLKFAQIYRKRPIIKETKEEAKVDEDITIKKKPQLTYPIPKPPPTRKADIFKMERAREIDRKAIDVDMESVPDIKSLSIKLTLKYFKDVEKVRAIFAWICSLNLQQLDYSRAITEKSPLHVLKEVKDGKSSYPELFATMCKCVDISCNVVTGVAKLENFEIGDTEIDKNKVTWNAVYVADGWRIVFFQWAFDTAENVQEKKTPSKGVKQDYSADKKNASNGGKQDYTTEQRRTPNGAQDGNEKSVPVSSKGGSFKDGISGESSIPTLPAISHSSVASKSIKEKASTSSHRHRITSTPREEMEESVLKINEYYFLTDPDEFIFRCFPDEDMWQLLGKSYSLEKFLKLPNLSQLFFENQLKISSRLIGIRKAKHGSCVISIRRMDPKYVFLKHSFELVSAESPDDTITLDSKYLTAVVHDYRTTHFHMRLPVAGMYDFKVFGGTTETDSQFLCSFKVRCDEPKFRFEPLPFVPEIGFGPCLETERYGMLLITNVTGIITIRGPDTVDIDFKLFKDIKVIVEMQHQTISQQELDDFISFKQHHEDLFISVGVPRNGEYLLKISAKHRRSKKDFTNVCNFLLMSEDPNKPRRPYESAGELMLRQQLINTLKTSKNPDEVQQAINRLNMGDLPDDGWLTRAYERLEYLKLARALRAGINRKNADVLEKAISDARQSNCADKLQNYIQKGEHLLKEAARNPIYILDMRRTTVSEIHRYTKPTRVMYDVMKATYLLLGEKPNSVNTWDEIVFLMKMANRDGLLYRVKKFDKNTVDHTSVEAANELLKNHTLEEARLSSLGVGRFFVWASDIVKKLLKTRKQSELKEENVTQEESKNQEQSKDEK